MEQKEMSEYELRAAKHRIENKYRSGTITIDEYTKLLDRLNKNKKHNMPTEIIEERPELKSRILKMNLRGIEKKSETQSPIQKCKVRRLERGVTRFKRKF